MIRVGERLWHGGIVTPQLAEAYNRQCEKIAAYEREGRPAPENLLNGRNNLLQPTGGA